MPVSNPAFRFVLQEFQDGSCPPGYGGNLYIRSPTGSVHLERSIFRNGHARHGGGAVINAPLVQVTHCVFENNSGTALLDFLDGGLNLSLDLRLESSDFLDNSGSWGGGFLASGIGVMPKLSVVNCLFERNLASASGGVGAVFPDADTADLTLYSNSGTDNVAFGTEPDTCDEFLIYLGGAYMCFGVDEDFSSEGRQCIVKRPKSVPHD